MLFVNSSYLLKNEKESEKKRKEKKNKHVVGEESDENVDVKNQIEVVWKTNRKEDEACGKENENKDKRRSGENNKGKMIKEVLFKTR